MAQSFLDKFRSSLPTSQGNQILQLLIGKRDSGEIRTVDEFKNKLKDLTGKLLAERITPTLKLFLATAGQDISSEQYNEMLDRIQDDLTTAFAEANNIDEIIISHQNIINEVGLKTLKLAINELESKINLYEFINRSGQGFDDALFNTFRESQNLQTLRSDSSASLVFADPRKKSIILSEFDAQVDSAGERLLLGAANIKYIQPKNAIWLANENSIRSEIDVSFPTSRIQNIIDGQNNTFWVVPILLSSVRSGGVPVEVYIGTNTTQDLNFIEIEPATNFPMTLVGIDYIDTNNSRQTLVIDSNILLTKPVKVPFRRVTANAIILKLQQHNYKEIQFIEKPGTSNFHTAVLGENEDIVSIQNISKDLNDLLSSDFILSDIFHASTPDLNQKKFFEYLIGFDNVRVGYNTFNDIGIFVSSKKSVTDPGQLALKVSEFRPTQISGSASILLSEYLYPDRNSEEDLKFYHSVVEYWITAQIFGEDNFLVQTVVFPLLPLGAERIYHEQLVFSRKSESSVTNTNMASLMFFTDPNPNDVSLYRNGSLLSYGLTAGAGDWTFVPMEDGDEDSNGDVLLTPADSEITQTIPGVLGQSMKRGIRLWDTRRSLDIYTVSYTPKVSNTYNIPLSSASLLSIVDLTGYQSIRSVNDNVVVIDDLINAHPISRMDLYLSIIMRRNSAEESLSPSVEEYMLITGSKDSGKFE